MDDNEELAGQPHDVDRTGWPHGPWDNEPDRADWKTEAGFPAIALRSPSGHWCGYVGVPAGHPAYDAAMDDGLFDVHGGITFGSKCSGHVCHRPEPGEPADVFWWGFDFAHSGDVSPSKTGIEYGHEVWSDDGSFAWWGPRLMRPGEEPRVKGHYRTLGYVREQCENAARQLRRKHRSWSQGPAIAHSPSPCAEFLNVLRELEAEDEKGSP